MKLAMFDFDFTLAHLLCELTGCPNMQDPSARIRWRYAERSGPSFDLVGLNLDSPVYK